MTTMIEKVKVTECFLMKEQKHFKKIRKLKCVSILTKCVFTYCIFHILTIFKGKFCSVLSKMIFDD